MSARRRVASSRCRSARPRFPAAERIDRPWRQGDLLSGWIRRWRHEVFVTSLDANTCRYEDRIEIDAGAFTPVVTAFASVFYRYRQRRWRALARLLVATAWHSDDRS